MKKHTEVGQDAIKAKGIIGAHKWLILRRISQVSIMFSLDIPSSLQPSHQRHCH